MSAANREQFQEMVYSVLSNTTNTETVKRSAKNWAIYVGESSHLDYETAVRVLFDICGIKY